LFSLMYYSVLLMVRKKQINDKERERASHAFFLEPNST
jgi:hypothetical protein